MPVEWPEQIAEGLPAPRDDEPPALRQDIADELSDHLQSALRRELHFEQDEGKAKQKVLTRFGNPSRLARRLWFDAIQEKIMSQRLTLLMSGIMAVACVAASAMAWIAVREGREVNAIIVNKLNALSPPAAVEAPKPMGWIPLKVQLVLDTKDGPPAEGYSVRFRGKIQPDWNVMEFDKKTGPDGVADFGIVRPGYYSFVVSTPWKESQLRVITVPPGRDYMERFVCPSKPPEEVEIAFNVDWPDDLRGKGLWVVCDFLQSPRQLDSEGWEAPLRDTWPGGQTVIVSSSGEAFSDAGTYRVLTDVPMIVGLGGAQHAEIRRNFINLDRMIEVNFKPQLVWRGPKHVLKEICIVDPQEDRNVPKRFPLLAQRTYVNADFVSLSIPAMGIITPKFVTLQPSEIGLY